MAGSATANTNTTNSTAAASKKKKAKSAVKAKSKKNENPTNNRVVPPLFPHPMAAAARGAMGMMMRPPVPPMMGLGVPPMMAPPAMAMRPAPFPPPNTCNPLFQQQQQHHHQMAMMCAQQAQQRTFMAAQAQKLEQQKAELAKKQQEMDQQKAEWDVQQEIEKEKHAKKKAKKTPKHRTNNPQLQILVEAAARTTTTTTKDHSAAEEESPPPIIRDKQGRKQWKQLTFDQRKAAYFAVQKRLAYTPALPTELSLPRGSIRRVAEEFGCMPSTIQRIWRLVNARIKSILQGNNPNTEQPQPEEEQEEEHDDSHLMGTLHYFGLTEQSQLDLILRHHEKALFKSGAANRKKGKSKWDAAQIKQAMEQIPLAEQRSIRSLSRALNIPNGTLHKLMKDNQWLIPEQRQKITFSQAKQQLAQTTNNKKRKSCPEDEDDFSLSFSDEEQPPQQGQQPENTTNTYGTTGTRQHAICETTRLAALIRDQTLCAHCHQQGSLELTFLATRASKAVGYKEAIPVGAPKLTCRNCQFVAFAGNATSKTILTPRYRNKEHVNK